MPLLYVSPIGDMLTTRVPVINVTRSLYSSSLRQESTSSISDESSQSPSRYDKIRCGTSDNKQPSSLSSPPVTVSCTEDDNTYSTQLCTDTALKMTSLPSFQSDTSTMYQSGDDGTSVSNLPEGGRSGSGRSGSGRKRGGVVTVLNLLRAKNGRKLEGGDGAESSRKSTQSRHQSNVKRQRRLDQREVRATIRMSIIIACFCGCWLGFFVIYTLNGLIRNLGVPHALDAFFFWLGYSNSVMNPVLYAIFNDDFRIAFQKILGCYRKNSQSVSRRRA